MEHLRQGDNPRDALPNHRERGRKRWSFTFDDLAAAAQSSVWTAERVDASDLSAVAAFVCSGRTRASKPITDAEVAAEHGAEVEAAWRARWPAVDAYRCAVSGCDRVLLARGLCTAHGGVMQPLQLASQRFPGHFVVRVGRRQVPLARVVMGDPKDRAVWHKDGNAWNNRPSNLVAISAQEAAALLKRARAAMFDERDSQRAPRDST